MVDFIVDGHSDILLNHLRDANYDFKKNTDFHIDLPKLKKGGVGLEIFAICSTLTGSKALKKTIQLLDRFNQLEDRIEEIELVKRYSDIDKAIKHNKIAVVLAVEGADGIFDLSALRIFHKLGIRLITLTWNNSNHIAGGISDIKSNRGLTRFGHKFIEEMNRLGIIIDVSHLNPASFWDVVESSDSPIVASHSNVKRLCDHPRNLTDDQIRVLAEKEGLIGINFCPEFLKNNGESEIRDIVEHIKYIKELVGIEHIGLGTDYDGISETPKKLDDISMLPVLINQLNLHNFTDEEIAKITRDNWLTLLKSVLKE